jgi:hypothetical protein
MKRDVVPFLRATASLIFAVAAFFAPWLHFALLFSGWLPRLNFDKITFNFFFVILPFPMACFAAVLALDFSEKPAWRRPAVWFLTGAVLYSPVYFLLVYWHRAFSV